MERQNRKTTITVRVKTAERVKMYGQFGQSYDDLLNEIIDDLENKIDSDPEYQELATTEEYLMEIASKVKKQHGME
jgi:small nuclear ribonucleoprotein (snRNP)-like protein